MKPMFYKLGLIFVSLFANMATAGVLTSFFTDEAPPMTSRWLVGLQTGASWSDLPNSTSVHNGAPYPTPYNQDQYSVQTGTNAVLALMGGYQWQQARKWLPAYLLAVRYARLFPETMQGVITQYSMPEYANYDYSWRFSSNMISLYSKIDLIHYGRISPFFDVGIGAASTRAGGFGEWALPDVTPRLSPGFAGQSNTNFAYNVGAGIDIALNSNWVFSINYDYQYLGSVKTGYGNSTWSNDQLNLGHYKGNMLLFGLTYSFDEVNHKQEGFK